MRYEKKLSMDKDDVIRRMAAKDFLVHSETLDNRYEYLKKICGFVKQFGKESLTAEHKKFFETELGKGEIEDLDTALVYADWRLQPIAIKKLYRAATKTARTRYEHGERE